MSSVAIAVEEEVATTEWVEADAMPTVVHLPTPGAASVLRSIASVRCANWADERPSVDLAALLSHPDWDEDLSSDVSKQIADRWDD